MITNKNIQKNLEWGTHQDCILLLTSHKSQVTRLYTTISFRKLHHDGIFDSPTAK